MGCATDCVETGKCAPVSCEPVSCQPCEPAPVCAPCEPVSAPICQDEVCTPEWDYVRKAKVAYKTEPYQAKVIGQKTVMVDQEQPYYKCEQRTKNVPCTVKKMIKVQEPCTKTVMKEFEEPYTSYKCEQFKVPFQREVCFTKEVPSTRKVCKQVKVPCTKTVMQKFPVQTTKKCQKEILVDSEREVKYQVKVPTTKTIKVPKQVCETKFRTTYKTETYKKPYECRIYQEPCILPAACPEVSACPAPVNDGCNAC